MINPEMVPTVEDWQALQGGRPRIFASPTGKSYEITHIYGTDFNYEDAVRYTHYGCVIPTIGVSLEDSIANPSEIEFFNTRLSRPQQRIIKVPPVLLIQHHGKACMDASYQAGHRDEGYTKIENRLQLQNYLGSRATEGYIEQRLAMDPQTNGFRLVPLVRVARAKR